MMQEYTELNPSLLPSALCRFPCRCPTKLPSAWVWSIRPISCMPMLHLTGTLVVLVVCPDDVQQPWDGGRVWRKYLTGWNVCMSGCLLYHSQSPTIVVWKCWRSCVLPYLEEKVPKVSEFESHVCTVFQVWHKILLFVSDASLHWSRLKFDYQVYFKCRPCKKLIRTTGHVQTWFSWAISDSVLITVSQTNFLIML